MVIQGVKNDPGIIIEIQAALQIRQLQQAHLARGLLCSEFSSGGLCLKSSDLLTNVRWWAFLEQLPDFRRQAHQDEILQFLAPESMTYTFNHQMSSVIPPARRKSAITPVLKVRP